ncbi:MAG: type I-G CRISPR-associated protein Cas8g1/Csx17, partial [Phycisphaerae bacterium]
MPEAVCHDIPLPGCTPEPLMAYLKALGILRLVSEQKDPHARGWWKNDVFWMRSALNRAAILEFFLNEYQPTPILSPWNGGSGFFLKWDEKKSSFKKREANAAIERIEASSLHRLAPYRSEILRVKKTLMGLATPVDPAKKIIDLPDQQLLFCVGSDIFAVDKADKDRLVVKARNCVLSDDALRWADAAFVVRSGLKKNRTEAPLLGSGGNIGNSDFSARFMQLLCDLLLSDEPVRSGASRESLRCSLDGTPAPFLADVAVDQFDPGRAGGANMGQGMEGGFALNPWDYILMLEGTLLLCGASSRRFGGKFATRSVFPFAVASTPSGFTSAGSDETRGEQWLPLWRRACTASEIGTLLSEGRSEVGRTTAQNGADFVRAAASLGVDRGIDQFVRIQYQSRLGDNYLANVVGRVPAQPQGGVHLLCEADSWLEPIHRAAGDEKHPPPPRITFAVHCVDATIFDFCKYGGRVHFQRVLIALGHAERALVQSTRFREKKKLRPLGGLSEPWINATDDGSREFAIAQSLASIYDAEKKIGPLRANLEPVDWQKRWPTWVEKGRSIIWDSAGLCENMASVLDRRLLDGSREGRSDLPLQSRHGVSLNAVADFIANDLDDALICDLLWGLILVRGDDRRKSSNAVTTGTPLPRAYALLKLLFLPRSLLIENVGNGRQYARLARDGEKTGVRIRPEPAILSLLRSGRLGDALAIAGRRLRVSGLMPLPHKWQELDRRSAWEELAVGVDPMRLTAALLIPIDDPGVNEIYQLCIRGE